MVKCFPSTLVGNESDGLLRQRREVSVRARIT